VRLSVLRLYLLLNVPTTHHCTDVPFNWRRHAAATACYVRLCIFNYVVTESAIVSDIDQALLFSKSLKFDKFLENVVY